MEQKCEKKEKIVKLKLWKMKFFRGILGKIRKKIRNTVIRDELKVEEIKNNVVKT